MAGYKGTQGKLVDSDYLYRTLKAEDDRRTKKLHDSLFETIAEVPEHYKLADPQDGSVGLLIVQDGTISSPDTEVELSTVTGKLLDGDLHPYADGEYVVLVPVAPEHDNEIYLRAATLDIEDEIIDVTTFDPAP